MDDKDQNESSTPDVPKSSNGKGKSCKPRHTKKNKEEKTVAILSSYMSSTEEIKAHICTTGSAMNKTFLMSREKFLGYTTTKFGNDVIYSLSERRVALMHTIIPTSIDHTTATLYEQRKIRLKQGNSELSSESSKMILKNYMVYCGTNVIPE